MHKNQWHTFIHRTFSNDTNDNINNNNNNNNNNFRSFSVNSILTNIVKEVACNWALYIRETYVKAIDGETQKSQCTNLDPEYFSSSLRAYIHLSINFKLLTTKVWAQSNYSRSVQMRRTLFLYIIKWWKMPVVIESFKWFELLPWRKESNFDTFCERCECDFGPVTVCSVVFFFSSSEY